MEKKLEREYQAELFSLYAQNPQDYGIRAVAGKNTTVQLILKQYWNVPYVSNTVLLMGLPGSGKTRAACNLVMSALKTLYGSVQANMGKQILFVSYNNKVIYEELRKNSDHGFSNTYLATNESDDYFQLTTQNVEKAIIVMGYKKFAMEVFPMVMAGFQEKELLSVYSSWTDQHDDHVEHNRLTIGDKFVSFITDNCILVFDEMHEMHSNGALNNHGMAVSYISQKYPEVKIVYISATPLLTKPEEIVCLYNIIARSSKKPEEFFQEEGEDLLPSSDLFGYLKEIGKHLIMLNPPSAWEYPKIIFEGTGVPCLLEKGVFLNYIKCPMTETQKSLYQKVMGQEGKMKICETCAIPSFTGEWIKGNNTEEHSLMDSLPTLEKCFEYSSKLKKIHHLLFDLGLLYTPGNIVIYSILRIYPDTVILSHFLRLCGLKELTIGEKELQKHVQKKTSNLCLVCKGPHHDFDHNQVIPYFSRIHSNVHKAQMDELLARFNSPENVQGHVIRVICGTTAISVSLSLYNVSKLITFVTPYSTARLIQLIGRVFRPRIINSKLIPQEVHIFLLLVTSVGSIMTLEEQRESQKTGRWRSIQKLVSVMASFSPTARFINLKKQQENYSDSPRWITKNKHKPMNQVVLAKDIHDFFLYPPCLAAIPKIDKPPIKRHPALDVMQDTKVKAASLLLRFLLAVRPRISEDELLHYIKKNTILYQYNMGSLSIEDFMIAAVQLANLGKSLKDTELKDAIQAVSTQENMEQLLTHIIHSDFMPWVIDKNWGLREIHFDGDWIYAQAGEINNLPPDLIEYVSPRAFIAPHPLKILDIELEIQPVLQIFIDFMKDDQVKELPLMIFEKRLSKSALTSFLMHIALLESEISASELIPFIQALADIRIILTKQYVKEIYGIEYEQPYPIVWANNQYTTKINGVLGPAPSSIMYYEENKPKTDVRLRIRSAKGYFFMALKTEENPAVSDRRREKKGIQVRNLNMSSLNAQLKKAKGVLGDKMLQELKTNPVIESIPMWTYMQVYKHHMEFPDDGYIVFESI